MSYYVNIAIRVEGKQDAILQVYRDLETRLKETNDDYIRSHARMSLVDEGLSYTINDVKWKNEYPEVRIVKDWYKDIQALVEDDEIEHGLKGCQFVYQGEDPDDYYEDYSGDLFGSFYISREIKYE